MRNNEIYSLLSILSPSNNAFEGVIFQQCPYNVIQLLLYLLLEYQIIIVSRRTAVITIFTECLLDLLRPFQWRGVYLPYVMNNHFDYENTSIPYIIGLEKSSYKIPAKFKESVKKRVVYDIDDNRFVLKTVNT